jgi:hypothetical protein
MEAKPGAAKIERGTDGRFTRANQAVDRDEYFGKQRNSACELGDPSELIQMLASGVVEVMAGMRDSAQLAPWLSEDVFLRLRERSNQARLARSSRSEPVKRPNFEVNSLRFQSPASGVIEAVVLLQGPTRVRAVTLRLEGYNDRWHATNLAVL